MTLWIIHAQKCPDCGSGAILRALDHQPTPEEISDLHRDCGGGWCIETSTFMAELNGTHVEPLDA